MDNSDINNATRQAVVGGVSALTGAGIICVPLAELFWPTSNDVWGDIKERVEELINQKLSEYTYKMVKEDLDGLILVLNDYTNALEDAVNQPSFIIQVFNNAKSAFELMLPHFKSEDEEVLLLPLLAPMANLHMALLRDGVLFGDSWGVPADTVNRWKSEELPNLIADYVDWVDQWYHQGLEDVKVPSSDPHRTQVWKARNSYIRQMTLDVLDHAFYWPYYDPTRKENVPKLTRTIFSDPYGTADNHGINLDNQPTAKITEVSIWGGSFIDGIQVKYGENWNPRMGSATGGTLDPPQGMNKTINSDNPFVSVGGRSGDILSALQFGYKNETRTNMCGSTIPGDDFSNGPYSGHIVSSINVMGISSSVYNCCDCLVVGFRYEDSY